MSVLDVSDRLALLDAQSCLVLLDDDAAGPC